MKSDMNKNQYIINQYCTIKVIQVSMCLYNILL